MVRDLANWKRETENYVLKNRDIIDYYEEIIYRNYDDYINYWYLERKKVK
jgi:hypothetical protein